MCACDLTRVRNTKIYIFMSKSFIYVVRGASNSKGAPCHCYFDVAFCATKKIAEVVLTNCRLRSSDTRYWINRVEFFNMMTMPF